MIESVGRALAVHSSCFGGFIPTGSSTDFLHVSLMDSERRGEGGDNRGEEREGEETKER
jgi:hypothetical protein